MSINDQADFRNSSACNECAVGSEHIVDRQIAGDQLFKFTVVTTRTAAHLLPQVLIAADQNVRHPQVLAQKILASGAAAAVLRIAVPEAGAAKIFLSTALTAATIHDLSRPLADTFQKAHRAQTLCSLTSAGDELAASLGNFAVDSAIGLAAGGTSQKITYSTLLAGLGHEDYLHFEYSKSVFWNRAARYLPGNHIETALKRLTHCLPQSHAVELTLEEQLNRIRNSGRSIAAQIENERFYKHGPVKKAGFSEYLDSLSGKTACPIKHSDDPQDNLLRQFCAANMSALAAAVKKSMSGFTNRQVQLADLKEQLIAPLFSTCDRTRYGALLGAQFRHSGKQLCDLAASIKDSAAYSGLRFILDLHVASARQDELKLGNVRRLNLFAEELHRTFIDGLKRAGISNRVLSAGVPSRFAIIDDHGINSFTIAPIPGVIDRPVTVFPRNMSNLESVLAGVNRHEIAGHDYLWGELKGIASELRSKVMPEAVNDAVRAAKIADTDIEVPEMGLMKKSKFFLKILQAQATENFCDLVGTASGGADTPLSLGLILQSLRHDGMLENRSFLGSRFDAGIEPHGIDRCRIKWCAELLRQLAPHDLELLKQARALDAYAASASHPETCYTWVSEDTGAKVAIPMAEWDALVPHIVQAQLKTPLESLQDKRLQDILPDVSLTAAKIEALAGVMERSLTDGQDALVSMFNPARHSVGEVYAAGLRAWMRMTAQGADPDTSLKQISKLSNKLCDLYLRKFR